jgi:histidine ammonia-lyase
VSRDRARTVAPTTLRLTGDGLDAETVARFARGRAQVELDPAALRRMAAARDVVETYLAAGRPAYGLTTGLGARVVERLPEDALATFSRQTVLGRANALGPPLPVEVVRASMLIRANGLARGGSGASPALAQALAALLGAGVHPVVPEIGSVGDADICLLSHVGLVLLGEGTAEIDGDIVPGRRALDAAGLAPLELAPKDGLALISSNAVSAAAAALALADGRLALEAAQIAAALSMEGFRASLTPLDERVAAARPAPGQAECAAGLLALLADGSLTRPGASRRLQDPLSFRCASQVHGSLRTALGHLEVALAPELNGAGDNPLVLAGSGEILSTGNFHVPALALAADEVALALAQAADLSAARSVRLLSAELTDLPGNLAAPGSVGAGLGPLRKTAGALVTEIHHGASPVTLASPASDGVEDATTGAPLATRRLARLLDRFGMLLAVELLTAARAVDLAAPETLGRGTGIAHTLVRELAGPPDEERPLGGGLDLVAGAVASGRLCDAVRAQAPG